jgi:hypothetical protein
MLSDNRHIKPDRNGFFYPTELVNHKVRINPQTFNIIDCF